MDPRFVFYDNRHNPHVWVGTPITYSSKLSNGRWFTVDQLPDVDDLGWSPDGQQLAAIGSDMLQGLAV